MSTLLTVRHLSKTFPGQVALDDFDFDLSVSDESRALGEFDVPLGRTHALVGQNGSGKSTFIKILSGYHQPDPAAAATFAGKPLRLGDARAAEEAGIRFVHQDLGLVDSLNAVENISMGVGYTVGRFGRIDWTADTARAREALADLGFTDIDVTIPVGHLAPSEKTGVAIARALLGWETDAHLLVLDEPTASLPEPDVERLFAATRRLKARGVAILYISHHLDEVFEIADEVTVLRDGKRVATVDTSEVDHDGLIELMIGHRIERRLRSNRIATGAVGGLEVRGLAGGTLAGVDLRVEPGEVVGVTGITGSGREMLVPFVTGQAPSDRGTVRIGGQGLPNYNPRAGYRASMAFLPADRARQGVIPLQSIRVNTTLSGVRRHWRGGRLRHREEVCEVEEWIDRLQITTPSSEVPVAALSGGNQQKVLFSRSLRVAPMVLVLDEPTHGIDVGAKEEILLLVERAAAGGAAVLVVSTDADEVVRLAHRVVVLRDGIVAEELQGDRMTAENVERALLQSQAGAAAT